MHLLTLPTSLSLGMQGFLKPDTYICEDRTTAELMLRCPGSHATVWKSTGALPYGKRILVICCVGFGDALMLTPCLRRLSELHPGATITVSCLREYQQAFLGLPYVSDLIDYPVPESKADEFDWILTLEHSNEYHPKGREQHMTDRFAEHLGLGELTNQKPDFIVSESEREWVWSSFPKETSHKRIGVQVQAGVRCRTYPQQQLSLLVNALKRQGYSVWLMGRPGEFLSPDEKESGIHNLARRGLTWRQSVVFLSTCDAFIGPDSSLLHAAGTLDVPAIGLFGPYPPGIRTRYYSSVRTIVGTSGCERHPCFHVDHGMGQFPIDQPCARTGRCEVLASINPERVVSVLRQMIGPTPH